MLTVIETPLFSKLWPACWSEDERGAFGFHIAEHPNDGDVVAGCGGVRVIYFVRNELGELVLMFMYAKAKLDTLKASTLKEMRDAVEPIVK